MPTFNAPLPPTRSTGDAPPDGPAGDVNMLATAVTEVRGQVPDAPDLTGYVTKTDADATYLPGDATGATAGQVPVWDDTEGKFLPADAGEATLPESVLTGWINQDGSLDIQVGTEVVTFHPDDGTGGGGGAGTTVVTVAAGQMGVVLGTPALGLIARTSVWRLDAAIIEDVGGTVVIPDGWATATIDLLWCNVAGGTGNVYLRTDLGPVVVGSAAPDAPAVSSSADPSVPGTGVVAPAQGSGVVVRTRMTPTAVTVTPGINVFECLRLGDSTHDTLPNDIGLIAAVFTKAS